MSAVKVSVTAIVVTALAAAVAAGALARSLGGVAVTMKEWATTPLPAKVKPGKVTFTIKNTGKLPHEFIVAKTNLPATKLPVKGPVVVLAKLKVEGKVPQFKPGQTRKLAVTLPAGRYVLFCNLPAHYGAGQRASFTVG